MEWNDSYEKGLDYVPTFAMEQGPSHLNFACVSYGIEPVPVDEPFTYMELGCGLGLMANVFAAANPKGKFFAVDFMPSHVKAAQEMAEGAQLDNLTVLEASFKEMAEGKIALPQFDYVTMYGIYSWVDGVNRGYIVEFLRRYLKPGGVVYVNYNAMPGWTASLSLRRLLREAARNQQVCTKDKLAKGRELVQGLVDVKARFFTQIQSRQLDYRLQNLRNAADDNYHAHEYLHDGADPMYSIDVMREMAGAKLDFAGSALLSSQYHEIYMSRAQQDFLASILDPGLRELACDHICNTPFRQDIFVRGRRRMAPARRRQWLERCGLALTIPVSQVTPLLEFPAGRFEVEAALYQPIMQALLIRPHSLLELAALPELRQRAVGFDDVVRLASLLHESEQCAIFFLSAAGVDRRPAERLNRLLAASARESDAFQVLASPLLGGGLRSGLCQRIAYDQIVHNSVAHGNWVAPMAQAMRREKPALEQEQDLGMAMADIAQGIMEQRWPIWKSLNMAPQPLTDMG